MSDDQDTTAPGRVAYPNWETLYGPKWATWLAGNIADAALEEMRVRVAVGRAMEFAAAWKAMSDD